jgi:hypothetical protein
VPSDNSRQSTANVSDPFDQIKPQTSSCIRVHPTGNIVKSITQKTTPDTPVNVPREVSRPSRSAERAARAGHWVESLHNSDVNRLWAELHRIVSNHPLVRASRSAGLLIEEGASSAYTDLTQELFVQLLTKSRFQHYLDTAMTDAEIECEIGQIELTNLLTAELRKRHPESYRLARRISTLIQSSTNFRRFDSSGLSEEHQHRRLADRVYGLSEWPSSKPGRNSHELEQRAHMIPVRQRDTRMVGCTGDAQIVISNSDLEDLIVSVLDAIDAPADVRTLRSLVMSRLPVMDIYLVPLGGDDGDSDGPRYDPADLRENPEESLLRHESEQEAAGSVDKFLTNLQGNVRNKMKQYNRMLGVLWHCYLSPDHATQLEVAATLGVSDSLVSDYRRRIEHELRALSFTEVEEARMFELALRERVRTLVAIGDEQSVAI